MKKARITAVLLALMLGFTFTASPLAEEAYGALRLMEDKPYGFHEVMNAMLEEARLRLLWLTQAGERFPGELLFSQALEPERERVKNMSRQFAAWGFAEEPLEPLFAPEVPQVFEQALKAMRDMAERGMMMSMRLEVNREVPEEDRFQAHMWGHEYRDQLDGCDLRADELGYAWAWRYEDEEPAQE